MSTGDPYRDGFMRIGAIYSRELSRMGEQFYQCVYDNPSVKSALLTLYGLLVRDGICIQVEDLSPPKRMRCGRIARTYFPGQESNCSLSYANAFMALEHTSLKSKTMSNIFGGSKAEILRYLREQKAAGKVRGFTDPDTEKPKKKKKKGKNIPKKPRHKTKAWIAKNLWAWCRANNLKLVNEHSFHETRKWRFDWALPDLKVAIEFEGIISDKSRHTSIVGYTGDAEKYSSAAILGWKVLRYTALNYKSMISDLEKLMASKP